MKHLLILLILYCNVFGAAIVSDGGGAMNWNDAGTWTGGVIPSTGDTVTISDGDTVSLDIAVITVTSITNVSTGTMEADSAVLNSLTADLNAVGTQLLEITGVGSVAIIGDITGGTGAGDIGVKVTNAATVTVTGNVSGGTGAAYGMFNGDTGTIAVTGNVKGGDASTSIGIHNHSTGTVTVSGSVTGGAGTLAYGIRNNVTGSVNTIGTMVIASNKAMPIGGWCSTLTVTTININGSDFAGTGAGSNDAHIGTGHDFR